MRRQAFTLALAGVIGTFAFSNEASACHKRRCKTPVTCAPVATVQVVPCPPPPVCETVVKVRKPRRRLFAGLCHKKLRPAPVVFAQPACDTCDSAPVYSSTVFPTSQTILPTGQGY